MSFGIGSPSHLEDADLAGYEGGGLDRDRQRLARAHLNTCPDCAARLHAFQRTARDVSSFLAAVDEPVNPDRREQALAAVQAARFRARSGGGQRRALLQAAAVVALLLTVSFGTPPGRAWVGGAVERLSGDRPGPFARGLLDMLGRHEQVAAAPAAAPAPAAEAVAEPPAARRRDPAITTARPGPPPGTSAPVQFRPAVNYVLVRFASRQRAGSAAIWIRETASGEGQVVSGRRGEVLQPTADGVLVRNSITSRAEYTITIPTSYRFVKVRIGDEPETVIAISRAKRDWLWTVSLDAADAIPAER